MKTIQAHEFEGQIIEFDLLPNSNLMVNATEMANIFGKDIKDYRFNKKTQDFIEALVLDANSNFAGGNSPLQSEKITSDFFVKTVTNAGQKNGTWMHRHVAIDFAMWLDVKFRIWVVKTIDEILLKEYKKAEEQLFQASSYISEIKQDMRSYIQDIDEAQELKNNMNLKYKSAKIRKTQLLEKMNTGYSTLYIPFIN